MTVAVLVDTSIWVDHLRSADLQLADLLRRRAVRIHPFVIGEIACGSLRDRPAILELLHDLPSAVVADAAEALGFIERHALHGKGIGYVDIHLLASAALTPGTGIWTRDKRLGAAAAAMSLAHP